MVEGNPHTLTQLDDGGTPEAKKKASIPTTGPASGSAKYLGHASIFGFMSRREKIYACVSCIAAVLYGAVPALSTIALGFGIGILLRGGSNVAVDIIHPAQGLVGLAIFAAVSSFAKSSFGKAASCGYMLQLRSMHFEAIMRQELAWHAETDTNEVMKEIAEDSKDIQNFSASRVATWIQFLISALCGFLISLATSWRLALVIYLGMAASIGSFAIVRRLALSNRDNCLDLANEKAATICHEALAHIKTVQAYGGEREEEVRFEHELKQILRASILSVFWQVVALGASTAFALLSIAFFFWYSEFLANTNKLSATRVLISLLASLCCVRYVAMLYLRFPALGKAQKALRRFLRTINRTPAVVSTDRGGIVPMKILGDLSLDKVTLESRTPEERSRGENVVQDVSVRIKNGTTHAFLGCQGKWAIPDLIGRFSDSTGGVISLDGTDIRRLHVSWFRDQVRRN